MSDKYVLPPRWVESEEQIEEHLEEIKTKLEMLERSLKDIKQNHIFSNKDDIPYDKITNANHEIINLIKTSEGNLRDIEHYSQNNLKNSKADNDVDEVVRKNVHYSLAIQLRDVTQRAKKFEKEFLRMVREQCKQDMDDLENNALDDDDFEDGKVEMKFHKRIQDARSKEIEDIVTSTNELAALFKELSVLVIDQGTILDRIDAHIEQSLHQTKKGNQHLKEAKKASESSRARNVII